MIIRSNPREDAAEVTDDSFVIGTGDITLKVDEEQLKLISALLMYVRLGQKPYMSAAVELITAIGDELGDVFFDEATEEVELYVTIEDSLGNVVLQTNDGEHFPTIEVD